MPRETLKVLKDNGLRLLLVGYESGNQQILINIKKGLRVDRARRFAADCRDLGITVHGTFILGLPGETETIQETIRFAREVNPHSLQVSVAAPYPGTELYRQAVEHGWLPRRRRRARLVSEEGTQLAALSYPHLEGPRSWTRWTRSTGGSTSAPARSPRCRPRCSDGPDGRPPDARGRGVRATS